MDLIKEKILLLEECKSIIQKRIETAQRELESYTAQSNEETKSSAGDKYETTRAMIHLEKEKIATQQNESWKLLKVLDLVKAKPDQSGLGKLIVTDQGKFFIAVSLGQVQLDKHSYFVISPVAPLGKLLTTVKVNDSIQYNRRDYKILEIG
ncbi:MAG: hypothetical protein ACJA08_002901 [Cyclobacteriaceae bacterium]|jgi:hypothetical protein